MCEAQTPRATRLYPHARYTSTPNSTRSLHTHRRSSQSALYLVTSRHISSHLVTYRHISSHIVPVGGINADSSAVSAISLLDLHTMTWHQRKCSPPVHRINHVAGYACGSLYLYGGSDSNGLVNGHELVKLRCSDFPQQSAVRRGAIPALGVHG